MLAFEIQELARTYGLQRLAFVTLTFKDRVRNIREAQRRFHSLATNVLAKRYERVIASVERHASKVVHFHLVVVAPTDVRTGFDWTAYLRCCELWQVKRDCKEGRRPRSDWTVSMSAELKVVDSRYKESATPELRSQWAFWRKTCKPYHFGWWHEFVPVRSTAEGIGRYVGKYIAKHVEAREVADKGARLVRFIGFGRGQRRASCRFSWANTAGWLWRRKLAAYCASVGASCTEELRDIFGPRWAYWLQGEIMAMHVEDVAPSLEAAEEARKLEEPLLVARVKAGKILEERKCSRVVVQGDSKFRADPLWFVPEREQIEIKPPDASVRALGDDRAREMRLFALRLPRVGAMPLGETCKTALERGRFLQSVQDHSQNSKPGLSASSGGRVEYRKGQCSAAAGEIGACLVQDDLERVGLCVPSVGSLPLEAKRKAGYESNG
jgi:hypothetical protein